MIKRTCSFIFLSFLILSCSVEKINLSPVNESFSNAAGNGNIYTLEQRKNLILYSSEITNLISSFPKFRNDAVNKEVGLLKVYLKDYIAAMEVYNLKNLDQAQHKFENSYKKLQKLRKYLNADQDEILSRYLVRIKINMSQLNSNIPQDAYKTN